MPAISSDDTWLDLVNAAGMKLGVAPLQSMRDKQKFAQIATLRYKKVRQYILRCHPWNCNRKYAVLAQSAVVPPFDWDFAYNLPVDFLRFDTINDQEAVNIGYVLVNGNLMYTNEAAINLIYHCDLDDPNQLDPLIFEAMATYLAATLSTAIMQSAQMKTDLETEFKYHLAKAKTQNANDCARDQMTAHGFLESRLTGPTPLIDDAAGGSGFGGIDQISADNPPPGGSY